MIILAAVAVAFHVSVAQGETETAFTPLTLAAVAFHVSVAVKKRVVPMVSPERGRPIVYQKSVRAQAGQGQSLSDPIRP